MSMKSRLFASVAAPVLSLPLLMQPAYALPSGMELGSQPSAAPGIIRVQEQVPAEGEEIPKRRKPQADEGEGAERPRGERQQRAEQPEGERPQRRQQQADQGEGGERPQRRQQQDAGQTEERPQPRPREQRAEQPEGERPQRRQQQADQGEGGGERPQRRQQNAEQAPDAGQQAKPDAEQAEQPKPRKERQQQAEQPKTEEPKSERPQRQQADQGDAVQPPKPRAQQNADQAPEPKQSETPDAKQAEQPKPRPERQQQAEQPDAEQPKGRPQQAERPQTEQPQGERPQRQQADQGEGGERPQRRPQQNADQAPVPAQPDQQPGQRPAQQAQDANKAPERAASGGERNQPRPVEQSAEQPMLPVENGAAVLDSAKEQRPDRAQRDGERPRRDGNRPDARAPDQQQAQERQAPPPRNDADAQANDRVTREDRERWRNQRRELVEERGQRIDGRPDFERPRGWDVLGPIGDALLGQNQNQDRNRDRGRDRNWDRDRDDGRMIISIDNQTYVRHDDSRRFYEDGGRPEYERLGDGRYREIVERSDGTRVVTIRNRYGEVVQRSRIVRGGKEYVLYYAPELLEDRQDYTWRDPGDDLPPMRLGVPIDDYIIDTSSEPDRDYYRFLEQPPVERVERPYSLDEVRYSARIRDKVPRIDLDTITFATGSAEIPMNQATSLRKVADAINKVLDKDPSETFLIEGHTDAVGSDQSNLVLSDRRAESVAVVLSDAFGIPPENMTTQGYGERYLKVNTEAANQENRRVTIRRITPLVKPVASNQ